MATQTQTFQVPQAARKRSTKCSGYIVQYTPPPLDLVMFAWTSDISTQTPSNVKLIGASVAGGSGEGA